MRWYPWNCPGYELSEPPTQARTTTAKLTGWFGSAATRNLYWEVWCPAGFQWVRHNSSYCSGFFVSSFSFCFVCNLTLIQSTDNLFLTQSCKDPRKPLLNSETAGPFPRANHLSSRQSGCRVQKGMNREIMPFATQCTIPKRKPMTKIPAKASTSITARIQRWRHPRTSAESLFCSAFHISGNFGLPQQLSCTFTGEILWAKLSFHSYSPGK